MLETFWVSNKNVSVFFILLWVDCICDNYESLLKIMQFIIKCETSQCL